MRVREDLDHERLRPGSRGVLSDQETHDLHIGQLDEKQEPGMPNYLLAPRDHFSGIRRLGVYRERYLDELLDLRQVECLGVADPNDSHPRFTHDAPSDPWNFAPAAPSET